MVNMWYFCGPFADSVCEEYKNGDAPKLDQRDSHCDGIDTHPEADHDKPIERLIFDGIEKTRLRCRSRPAFLARFEYVELIAFHFNFPSRKYAKIKSLWRDRLDRQSTRLNSSH